MSDRLVEETQRFGGGSLMMWDGVGYGCKIDGKMYAELYTKILDEDLCAILQYYKKSAKDIFFQQDGDSKQYVTSGSDMA